MLLTDGRNRRMERDKARIELGKRSLYKRSLDFLRQHFKTMIIAGDCRADLARKAASAVATGSLRTGDDST